MHVFFLNETTHAIISVILCDVFYSGRACSLEVPLDKIPAIFAHIRILLATVSLGLEHSTNLPENATIITINLST
jgi:hypothetical protein